MIYAYAWHTFHLFFLNREIFEKRFTNFNSRHMREQQPESWEKKSLSFFSAHRYIYVDKKCYIELFTKTCTEWLEMIRRFIKNRRKFFSLGLSLAPLQVKLTMELIDCNYCSLEIIKSYTSINFDRQWIEKCTFMVRWRIILENVVWNVF